MTATTITKPKSAQLTRSSFVACESNNQTAPTSCLKGLWFEVRNVNQSINDFI